MEFTLDTTLAHFWIIPGKAVIDQYAPGVSTNPMIGMVKGMTLRRSSPCRRLRSSASRRRSPDGPGRDQQEDQPSSCQAANEVAFAGLADVCGNERRSPRWGGFLLKGSV